MNDVGRLGEIEACKFLKKRFYKLIASNYSTRFGEIDLIMKKGKYICFIEVKTRSDNSIAKPREFVDYNKQQRIIKTAQLYLQQNNTKLQPRFDVVEVFCENNKIKSIKHLENAFELY